MMDVLIYSVKANSKAGNVTVNVMTTQKGQNHKKFSARDLKNLYWGALSPGKRLLELCTCL